MRTLLIAIIMLSSLLENGWCQNPRPTTSADLAKYGGADRERLLYDGAKKEGKLVWYTSLSSYKEVSKSFESKYPGVTVEFYRASGTTLATRILSESSARPISTHRAGTDGPSSILFRSTTLACVGSFSRFRTLPSAKYGSCAPGLNSIARCRNLRAAGSSLRRVRETPIQ